MSNTKNEALFIIDDTTSRSFGMPRSGWDFDNRGEGDYTQQNWSNLILKSVSTEYPVIMKRDFYALSEGVCTFEGNFNLIEGNGFTFEFGNSEMTCMKFVCKDGIFQYGNLEISKAENKEHHLKVIFNLDKSFGEVIFNGKYIGKYDFLTKAIPFSRLKIGFPEKAIGEAYFSNIKLYTNYYINDKVLVLENNEMPYGFKTEVSGEAHIFVGLHVENNPERAYISENSSGATSKTYYDFNKATGIICFETKYLLSAEKGIATFSLLCDNTEIVSVNDKGFNLCSKDISLRKHHCTVWQTLIIEANTNTQKALIKLNGKKTIEIDFEAKADYFNKIKFEYTATEKSKMMFGDIQVFELMPEPLDYVPEPIMPKKKDYYVGMNICSLWRTGDHWGWDVISPFDEVKPLLGYYDEGIPEVADWEIKWMAEHGIDFELYCWYSTQENAPIKTTVLSSSIHGGHFHAKYSDKVKLALLWEAANAAHPMNSESFRNYFVPYWIDYFFSDPRYMRIENKAIMSVFGAWELIKSFGDAQGVRREFDYLRSEVKKLGYDDLIIMACSGANQMMKDCGFDAVHAYNWGSDGYDPDFTKGVITENIGNDIIHVVPTVSTGFNNVGWAGTRHPNMKPCDMDNVLSWFKSDILPKNEKDSWKSKLCMLSTWNEYGEGTYMMPSGLNEFGYLDAVRKNFCEDVPHVDVKPNKDQLSRLGYLQPKDRAIIRRLSWFELPVPKKVMYTVKFNTPEEVAKYFSYNIEEMSCVDGVLVGKSILFDPQVISKDFSLNVSNCTHLRIRMKSANSIGTKGAAEFYFTTEESPHYSGDKGLGISINSTEMQDYIIPIYKIPTWHGIVNGIRIDPLGSEGTFSIESIEFLQNLDRYQIFLNGLAENFGIDPIVENGELYIPFNPISKLPFYIKVYHEWNKKFGVLTLWNKLHKISLTVGSNKAIIDNNEIVLKKPIFVIDGLPMLPMNELNNYLDVEISLIDKNIYIK